MIHPEVLFRGSLSISIKGLEGFRGYLQTVWNAFPDFKNTIEDIISEGDKVVARILYEGTHEGELFGMAPTGNKVSYPGIAIFRLEKRKIVECWVVGDTLGLMRQMSTPKDDKS